MYSREFSLVTLYIDSKLQETFGAFFFGLIVLGVHPQNRELIWSIKRPLFELKICWSTLGPEALPGINLQSEN